jgi:hypothetical protein
MAFRRLSVGSMNLGTLLARTLAGLVVAVTGTAAVAAGGGALNDPQETYSSAWVRPDRPTPPSDGVVASVTIQFVSYALNSVGGKYKLIPVLLRIDSRPAALPLAIDQDRLFVLSNGKKIPASFQLSVLDRPLWDSLTPDMKKRLTYPEQLPANSTVVVYAFVPLADLQGPPEAFEYTIKALPAPLTMVPEPKKKAASLSVDARRG